MRESGRGACLAGTVPWVPACDWGAGALPTLASPQGISSGPGGRQRWTQRPPALPGELQALEALIRWVNFKGAPGEARAADSRARGGLASPTARHQVARPHATAQCRTGPIVLLSGLWFAGRGSALWGKVVASSLLVCAVTWASTSTPHGGPGGHLVLPGRGGRL